MSMKSQVQKKTYEVRPFDKGSVEGQGLDATKSKVVHFVRHGEGTHNVNKEYRYYSFKTNRARNNLCKLHIWKNSPLSTPCAVLKLRCCPIVNSQSLPASQGAGQL
eukprot:1192818-Prorocentrum_minimum.AAC.1